MKRISGREELMSQKTEIPKKIDAEQLLKFYDIVAACNRCGFCTSYCPTYNSSGDEGLSPRGRNQTFRALIEGKIAHPEQADRIVDSCLLCGECTSVCFSEVPTAQLMVHARHYLNEVSGVPGFLSLFLRWILPRRWAFRALLKTAFFMKRLGISGFLRKLGMLKKIAPTLATADELVDQVPIKFLTDYKEAKLNLESAHDKADHSTLLAERKIEQMRQRHDTIPEELMKQARAVRRPKIAYFPVCGSQYLEPEIGLSSLRLCQFLNFEFIIPDLLCCGLPAASYGVLEDVRKIAQENIIRLERGNYEALIVDDASCASHIKDYPSYFQEDRAWQTRAQVIAQKVRDLSSFLLQRGLPEHLSRVSWTQGPVAYHDPCKAQYSQKITQAPRELLSSIKNLNLVPIEDSDQCCGGGGTYSFVHPELSRDVLSRKIKNVAGSGCRTLVSSAASCLIQLRFGMKEVTPPIKVFHLSEFLSSVLKLN